MARISNTRIEKIEQLVEEARSREGNYFDTVETIALLFPSALREQLKQLVNGPVYDGNIISKGERGVLFDMGIAIRVCKGGKQGYTGSKYIGFSILKKLKELDDEMES